MKSLADGLPPDIAQQIHPDWRKNEAAYWAIRDRLLRQYQGQWIGFADGAVVASGTSPVAVFHAAEATGRNPFVTCVGHEDEPTRMRRVRFAYDGSYRGEPLPILTVEFRPASGSPGVTFRVWVYLDGQEYPCRLQADFVGTERILGRDVLNRLETLFRG